MKDTSSLIQTVAEAMAKEWAAQRNDEFKTTNHPHEELHLLDTDLFAERSWHQFTRLAKVAINLVHDER